MSGAPQPASAGMEIMVTSDSFHQPSPVEKVKLARQIIRQEIYEATGSPDIVDPDAKPTSGYGICLEECQAVIRTAEQYADELLRDDPAHIGRIGRRRQALIDACCRVAEAWTRRGERSGR